MHPGEVGSGEVVDGRARKVLVGSIWPQHAVDVSAAVAGFGLRIPCGLEVSRKLPCGSIANIS